jgi:hypothetical protein
MLTDLRVGEWRPSFGPVLVYVGILAAITLAVDLRLELWDEEYLFEKAHLEIALPTAALLIAVMAIFGPMERNAFIYFQF